MKRVTNIYVNIDSLASYKEAKKPTDAEREDLIKLLKMLVNEDFGCAIIEATRQGGTQNSPRYSAEWQGTPVSSSTGRGACKSSPSWSTEKKKAIAELLRPQTRALRCLVREQGRSTPIRLRTYDPQFAYNLLSQVETLLNALDGYVFPLLEPTDSSKH